MPAGNAAAGGRAAALEATPDHVLAEGALLGRWGTVITVFNSGCQLLLLKFLGKFTVPANLLPLRV